MLSIALPKGRLGENVYRLLEKSGYECKDVLNENTRKLVFENEEKGVRYFWVKPSDVGIYVEYGVADIGIEGKDILLEYGSDVYELKDLGIGCCRMCIAGPQNFKDPEQRSLRVATKFPHIARNYFESKGRDIEIIKLHGSIELAPILSLADVICDIVETGNTLKENNLVILEEVTSISARLIGNKIAYQFKFQEIQKLMKALEEKDVHV